MTFLRSAALVALIAVGMGTMFALPQRTSIPPEEPVRRTDENSLIAHAQLLDKARAGGIDLYFEGDSIVRRWGATDYPDLLAHWNATFFGWNAANFGWGGDTTQNILWRLQDGELDGVHPKVIVLLAGTNDVGRTMPPDGDDQKAARIGRGIRSIVALMREKAPDATIIVMGVFPRNDNPAVMSTIRKINQGLMNITDGDRILFLDINERLADEDGRLFEGMTGDGLHPTIQGYRVWADALVPILTTLLAPPALEDHAPPPTGNPAASGRD